MNCVGQSAGRNYSSEKVALFCIIIEALRGGGSKFGAALRGGQNLAQNNNIHHAF